MRRLFSRIFEYQARRAVLRHPGVCVDPTVKLDCRRVQLQTGGSITIGAGSMVEGSLVLERDGAAIEIGRNTFIGNSILAAATRIEVGDDVLVSWGCGIVDHNSHALGWHQRRNDVRDWYHGQKDWTHVKIGAVKIGDRSWIGMNAIILKGVEIGMGAIVAAGSVVTKDVPPWTIAAGNPARVIREIPVEEQ